MKLKLTPQQNQAYQEMMEKATYPWLVERVISEVYKTKGLQDLGQTIIGIFESTREKWYMEEGMELACKKGCAMCCYLNVDVFKAEMQVIRAWLKKNATKDQVQQYKAKGVQKYELLKGLTLDQKTKKRVACAFLGEDSTCQIYEVRPVACRQFNSFRLDLCEEGFRDPSVDVKNAFWANPMEIGKDISLGVTIALYLKEGIGAFDKLAYSLEEGIFRML